MQQKVTPSSVSAGTEWLPGEVHYTRETLQNLQNCENVAGVAVVDESTSTENFMDLSNVWCL